MPVNYFPPWGTELPMPVSVGGIGIGHRQEPVSRPDGLECAELHYTVTGCGIVEFDGRRHLLPAGTMLYSPILKPHRYYPAPGGWTVNWIQIQTPRIGAATHAPCPFRMLRMADDFLIFRPRASGTPSLTERFETIYRIAAEGESGRILAAAELYTLLCELACELEAGAGSRDHSRHLIDAAVGHIERTFTEPIPLGDLCRICGGISEQYLCRLFKKHIGMKPTEYINRRRLEYARRLLVETTLPVADIAARSGFESVSYFHRLWKRYEKSTPADYRETHAGLFI